MYILIDLIDRDKLQQIQDAFAEANGVACTIVDVHGVPITRPSNHSEVCNIIRSSAIGMARCRLSGEKIGLEAARMMKPYHQSCLSCGFTDAAAPIVINGNHIANWLIGQYYVCDVDERRIKEYAAEIGVDQEKMIDAFRRMPKISRERFEKILSFLWLIANEISLMGYQNVLQKQQTQELIRVQQQLEKHQGQLEQMVADRTADLVQLNEKLTDQIAEKIKIEKKQSILITAIESAAEAIIITDADAEILYVNPAFEKICGYGSEEIIGKTPRILKSGIHDEQFYTNFWNTIQSGRVWSGRFRNRNKSGMLYEEDTTVSSVMDNQGKIVNYVAVKRDITKELELERQLAQAGKLEAIGTLAAGIAHEINTPIQYVRDNTKFLEEAFFDLRELQKLMGNLVESVASRNIYPEEVAEIRSLAEEIDLDFLTQETTRAIEVALEGLERISSIVMAMKEFSHQGGTEKRPEDLNRIIATIVTVSRSEWKKSAEIELDLEEKLPEVPIFSGKIKQALLNLVMNAAQAIEEKTRTHPQERGTITISTSSRNNRVFIHVSDTGIGIPASIIKKIFDPFFTTKEVGKGTGQGLSIAYSIIVEAHNGTIDVFSKPGAGAEFVISLPC